jgi:hypothetical protein
MKVRVWIKSNNNPYIYSDVTECVIHDSGLWLIIIIGEVREIMYPSRSVEYCEILEDEADEGPKP